MTQGDKVSRMIQWLTTEHLSVHGGYPYGCDIHHRMAFIATLDDSKDRNRTLIERYSFRALEKWYDGAVAYLGDNLPAWPDDGWSCCDWGDWSEAFRETEQRKRS